MPHEVGSLRRAVAAVAAELGLEADRMDLLQLAVSEALSNVVLHAYEGAGGEMRVGVERDENELRVTIGDDGPGLSARPGPPGLGLGLGIIVTGCDRCEIASKPESGTRLTMIYDLED